MRIAIDVTPAAVQFAGVGRYTRELVRELLVLPGDDTWILACAADESHCTELLTSLPPGAPRVLRRIMLPERAMTILWQRARIPVRVERLIGDCDLLHATDFVAPPTRARLVVTIHDVSYLKVPHLAEPSLATYLRSTVPRTLRRAAAVIAVSASVAADLAEAYPWVRHRIVAIPNGVRPPSEPTVHRDVGRPVILFLGTIEPRKNLPALYRAMEFVRERHPDALLVVAGRIGWRSDAIVDELLRLAARGQARFVESPADADIDDLFAQASVFVYPSVYEGFGLPVLEAMARGVPVVTSTAAALVETGGEAAAYADADDSHGMADAILRLIDDERARLHATRLGLQRAAQHSWRESALRTYRVYRHASGADG